MTKGGYGASDLVCEDAWLSCVAAHTHLRTKLFPTGPRTMTRGPGVGSASAPPLDKSLRSRAQGLLS